MNKKRGAVILFVALLIFWMILSTELDLISSIIGALASFLIVAYNYDLIFNKSEATKFTFRYLGRLIVLGYHLIVAIIVSNIHVALIVLSPKMKIEPGFKKIPNPLKKDVNQTLFANAITLTPGTLTVDMDDDYILIHGLELSHIDDISTSKMQKAFEKLEDK